MSFFLAAMALASTQSVPEGYEVSPPQEVSLPKPPLVCTSDQHGQFDFWLGEWEVFAGGSDELVGHSKIERIHRGCAIQENWMPLDGMTGSSLNSFDSRTGQWLQTWVGSSPLRLEFSGGFSRDSMVLTGNWPMMGAAHRKVRMTFTPNEDGSVSQLLEASTNHGVSWHSWLEYTYRPKASDAE